MKRDAPVVLLSVISSWGNRTISIHETTINEINRLDKSSAECIVMSTRIISAPAEV